MKTLIIALSVVVLGGCASPVYENNKTCETKKVTARKAMSMRLSYIHKTKVLNNISNKQVKALTVRAYEEYPFTYYESMRRSLINKYGDVVFMECLETSQINYK